MTILVTIITKDKLVCRWVPIKVTEKAARNGELPKVIERPIFEGKYWAGELVLHEEPAASNGIRRYELIQRGDEIWYAEVGDVSQETI